MSYEEDIVDKVSPKPKLFYSYIHSKKVDPSIGPLRDQDGLVSDPQSMAEILDSACLHVCVFLSIRLPSLCQILNSSCHDVGLSVESVAKAFK